VLVGDAELENDHVVGGRGVAAEEALAPQDPGEALDQACAVGRGHVSLPADLDPRHKPPRARRSCRGTNVGTRHL
jgi:hypothetical protein